MGKDSAFTEPVLWWGDSQSTNEKINMQNNTASVITARKKTRFSKRLNKGMR